MPLAIDPALKLLVQTLYLQGHKPFQISAKTGIGQGTIKTWAHRHGWLRAVNKTKDIADSTIAPVLAESANQALAKASTRTRHRAAKAIEEALDVLPTVRSWNQAAKVQSQLEPLVRNAKQVFGWSENSTEPAVRINLLASTAVVQVQDKHSFPAPALPKPPGQTPFDQA